MAAIKINQIQKTYGDVQAVQPLSFDVEEGELFGLIGPDGAGKTTLIKILVTLLTPDKGSASILNLDVVKDYLKIREIVGYMPGRFALYQDLSIQENMEFFARIFKARIADQMDLIGDIYKQIEPFKNRLAGQLSGGMKQKLALCCALVHRPKILILDEPTTGVDAVSRKEFWEMLQKVQTQGISILVSTPYMDEAARCNRVALMQEGKVIALDKPKAITANFKHPIYAVKADDNYLLINTLKQISGLRSIYPSGEYAHLVLNESATGDHIKKFAEANGATNVDVKIIEPDIEDSFIETMQHGK